MDKKNDNNLDTDEEYELYIGVRKRLRSKVRLKKKDEKLIP